MIVVQFIFAWLAIFGASWIIADSKISLPVRSWIAGYRPTVPPPVAYAVPRFRLWLLDLLECPACLSFWIGLVVAVVFLDLLWLAIPFALASCGISLVLFLEVKRLG